MKFQELTTKTASELEQTLGELRAKLAQMRFDLADKKLKRTSDIHATKIQIAQILTVLKTIK